MSSGQIALGARLRDRPFETFLSHAHVDKAQSDQLFQWLSQKADVKVWYDADVIRRGTPLVRQLENGVSQSRGLILLLSKSSLESGWVQQELDMAHLQKSFDPNFRIICIRTDASAVPAYLATYPWIEAPDGKLSVDDAVTLLSSLECDQPTVDYPSPRDVYFSATWQTEQKSQTVLPKAVSELLMLQGFRLVGDSRDQQGFIGGNRVRDILQSCGGCVAVLPHRGEGTTSNYIIHEVEMAAREKLPTLVFIEHEVVCELPKNVAVCRLNDSLGNELPGDLKAVIAKHVAEFSEQWQPAAFPHWVFYAKEFKPGFDAVEQAIIRLVRSITGMPCVFGDDIREGDIPSAIVQAIKNSFLTICDISGQKLNTCIEAGVALGAGKSPILLMEGERTSSQIPFMFRSRQNWFYQDSLELVALLRRLVRPYRRRIIEPQQF